MSLFSDIFFNLGIFRSRDCNLSNYSFNVRFLNNSASLIGRSGNYRDLLTSNSLFVLKEFVLRAFLVLALLCSCDCDSSNYQVETLGVY